MLCRTSTDTGQEQSLAIIDIRQTKLMTRLGFLCEDRVNIEPEYINYQR
jgi:hypothetical protein